MTTFSRDLQSHLYRRLIAKEDGPAVKPAPKAAGIAVKAADTGRILMLQRSYKDIKDPARGKWEFPGGTLEPGEDAHDAAVREWQEEVGHKLPPGRHAGTWTSPNGVYRGHLYITPTEDHVDVRDKGKIGNPDDPDGDDREALAWFDPHHIQHNPAVRREVRSSTDWDVIHQKPLPSDKESAQQWTDGAPGPKPDRSPLVQGPQGTFTPHPPTAPGERFPTGYVTVQPKNKRLKVLLADSPARRTIGLQNTPDLSGSEYDGMLFIYPADTNATFHNRNVAHPVGATWFDSSGMYVDHAHMLADDPTPVTPRSSHRYALEVHADDMDKFGLGPGSSMDMHQDQNDTVQMGDGLGRNAS